MSYRAWATTMWQPFGAKEPVPIRTLGTAHLENLLSFIARKVEDHQFWNQVRIAKGKEPIEFRGNHSPEYLIKEISKELDYRVARRVWYVNLQDRVQYSLAQYRYKRGFFRSLGKLGKLREGVIVRRD